MDTTTRLGLAKPAEGDPVTALRESVGDHADKLDQAALYDQGAASSRPTSTPESPGLAGQIYRATDTDHVALDTGTGWIPVTHGSFRAQRSSVQAIPDFLSTIVVFDSVQWNLADWYNPSTGRFTPKQAGVWRLCGAVYPSLTTDGEVLQVNLLKNGSYHRLLGFVRRDGQTWAPSPGTTLVRANGTTDYFQISVDLFADSARNVLHGPDTFFEGEFVGP